MVVMLLAVADAAPVNEARMLLASEAMLLSELSGPMGMGTIVEMVWVADSLADAEVVDAASVEVGEELLVKLCVVVETGSVEVNAEIEDGEVELEAVGVVAWELVLVADVVPGPIG